MASLPTSTVLEQCQVSLPPATVGDRSLVLTFFDIFWLTSDPVHTIFFYELPITKTQFTDTVIPNLKSSLSTTLQHFFPFAGKLIVFPTPTKKPEVRYVEGDSVSVTFTESTLDFNNLTGNHPRDCDQFYHLISPLGEAAKVSDFVAIPVFSVQVTLFPNHGFSIAMTNHHCIGDASSRFCFLKAWASIAQSGSDESFLATGTLPCFDRLINYPELDENYLKFAKVESINEEYQPPRLSGPSDKVRATVILTRSVTNRLKKLVSTQVPTLPYVSSFTVSCAYIWSCVVNSGKDELELFSFQIDCRTRIDPPIPAGYFGNCVSSCLTVARTSNLTGKEGFVRAAKMIGENLHKVLTEKNGVVKDVYLSYLDLFTEGFPTTMRSVAGTPKFKFYDLDFGWGKPKKHETVSIDYGQSISVNATKESAEDLEIGVSLPAAEMEKFLRTFEDGLETYI